MKRGPYGGVQGRKQKALEVLRLYATGHYTYFSLARHMGCSRTYIQKLLAEGRVHAKL